LGKNTFFHNIITR